MTASSLFEAAIDADSRPFVLIWETTQACELACEHCRADAQEDRHPGELSTAQARSLLEEARTFGDGQLVVLSGGDPLCRPDVTDLVSYGTELGLRMTMTPSGTSSLSRERIAALSTAGLERMAVSLDGGSADMHDAFRGEVGSFEDTLAAARQARDIGIPLQINTTVCAATVDELPAIRDLVSELDAVLWSVFFLVPVGRGRLLQPISPARAERVMTWLYRTQQDESFGVKTTEAPHYRRVALEMRRRETSSPGPSTSSTDAIGRRVGITAGDGFAFVSHTGELYPSGFLPKTAGNVRDGGLVDLYRNSSLFDSLRDKDSLTGPCGACEYRHVCGGSRSRAYAETGDPLASDPLCAYVPEEYSEDVNGSISVD